MIESYAVWFFGPTLTAILVVVILIGGLVTAIIKAGGNEHSDNQRWLQ